MGTPRHAGVQISLARFDKTTVAGTAELGAGLTWGQVCAALDPIGISVIGGRVGDVGISGLTLGGSECRSSLDASTGHRSMMCNKYGLSIDNVVSYELVLPNGAITSVTFRKIRISGSG